MVLRCTILFALGALTIHAEPSAVVISRILAETGFGQVVQVGEEMMKHSETLETTQVDGNTPIVMMHGMGDFANNPLGMVPIRKKIAADTQTYVHSVEICSKPTKLSGCTRQDQNNGFLMSMDDQID